MKTAEFSCNPNTLIFSLIISFGLVKYTQTGVRLPIIKGNLTQIDWVFQKARIKSGF